MKNIILLIALLPIFFTWYSVLLPTSVLLLKTFKKRKEFIEKRIFCGRGRYQPDIRISTYYFGLVMALFYTFLSGTLSLIFLYGVRIPYSLSIFTLYSLIIIISVSLSGDIEEVCFNDNYFLDFTIKLKNKKLEKIFFVIPKYIAIATILLWLIMGVILLIYKKLII